MPRETKTVLAFPDNKPEAVQLVCGNKVLAFLTFDDVDSFDLEITIVERKKEIKKT